MDFKRELKSIPDIFDFLESFYQKQQIDSDMAFALNLAAEEIFTNFVKYNPQSTRPIRIRIEKNGSKVKVFLSDIVSKPFDIVQHQSRVHTLLLNERPIGGLGLRLVKKMVDGLDYKYNKLTGEYTITITKYLGEKDV